ncbi:phage tail sheath family protein [Collimonas humicola]|uniref:phage tail sheath family protein n=1 Tax=Collimonas humicola TaxID=2825886 RepID=UPI001B8ABC46|nr:phage tail sheath C-terminal domain-containing protein [Collimonas humicola]
MAVETKYPGVYIREIKSQFSTVASGATAVPVFALNTANAPLIKKTTRIADWLSFTKAAVAATEEFEFDAENVLHLSMKTYFDNGGGYCYLTPTDRLQDDVPALDDVTMLVAAGQDIKGDVVILCQSGNTLFAVLDAPDEALTDKSSDLTDGLDTNSFAAAYYPWLEASWAETEIPPSAAVAGMICSVDRQIGAWKAPANVVLSGGLTPKYKVSDDEQGQYMNGKAVNMIRDFGRGPTIWGARTLDAVPGGEWTYVPVRRLFNAVEKDVKRAVAFSLFEPNTQPTWERVRSAISNYLYALWRQGGLFGDRPEQAYFVQIGKGVTMTDDDITNGRMIVKIGLAAIRPAEYIILQFTQDMVTV